MSGMAIKGEDGAVKEIFSEEFFSGKVLYNEPMSRHTSLGIGGPADALAAPSDIPSLKRLMVSASEAGIPVTAIGGGTNILVGDGGLRGIAVSLAGFDKLRAGEDGTVLHADAGLQLRKVVSFSKKTGLSGMEGLSGIPGTFGGAIAGNAGSYGNEMKDLLIEVSLMDPDGVINLVDARDIRFGYRRADIPAGSVIISASVRLKRDDPREVLRRAAEYLKQKKATQPIGQRSAGCVFKNPASASAGRLIEEAGCKGMKHGGVEVSAMHANFFIARSGATAEDFLRLMDEVAARVKEGFGVVLDPEIRIIGC